MTDKLIEYKSALKTVATNTNVLETIDRDGIVCTWNGKIVHDNYTGYKTNLSWNFNWSKLKNEGVERITGHLIVKGTVNNPNFGVHKIDLDLNETTKIVTKEINYQASQVYASYEYRLTLHYAQQIENIPYDEMFAASEMNDSVLVIEGKKVHVNKAFLSYHSEFFRALFSSNFKEGQMTEIPIKDVTYQGFGLLMSIIYPKQVMPTDKTAEKLLKLADRFLMCFVTRAVEHHLLEHSNISNEKLMWMADVYKMPRLLEKCIRMMDTVEKANKLKASPEYQKLSLETIEKLFCRILQIPR